MTRLLHLLHMIPIAAIAVYLISDGRPAYVAYGLLFGGFEIVMLLFWIWERFKPNKKSGTAITRK